MREGAPIIAALLAWCVPALAGPSRELRAIRAACTPAGVDSVELRRVLEVELVRGRAPTERVEVLLEPKPCPTPAFALVLVDDAGRQEVRVSLADVPVAARARTIAIVVREQLAEAPAVAPATATVEAPPVVEAHAPVETTEPAPLPAAASGFAPPSAGPAILAVATLRFLPRYDPPLVGLELGLHRPLAATVHLELAIGSHYATASHALGRGHLLLAAASAALTWGTRAGPLWVAAGPRAEAGVAWQWADPARADVAAQSDAAPVFSVGGMATAAWPLAADTEVVLGLQAGGVARGTDGLAAGHTLIGFGGWVVGATMGARMGL